MLMRCERTGKVKQRDRKRAQLALSRMKRNKEVKGNVSIFRCRHCGFYHLGRKVPGKVY